MRDINYYFDFSLSRSNDSDYFLIFLCLVFSIFTIFLFTSIFIGIIKKQSIRVNEFKKYNRKKKK